MSQWERKFVISDDYVVYLQEARQCKDPVSFLQAIESNDIEINGTKWSLGSCWIAQRKQESWL